MIGGMGRQLTRGGWIAAAAVGLCAGGAALAAGAAGDSLLAASDEEHLWLLMPETARDGTWEVRFHCVDFRGPYFQRLLHLPAAPEALAAWDDRLWLVFPTDGGEEPSGQARREVLTVRARPHLMGHGYVSVPRDRMELLPALPTGGRLDGLVGTEQGPVALLMPSEMEGRGDRLSGPRELPEAGSALPRLVRLDGRTWQEIPLPAELGSSDRCLLAAGGRRGERLHVLAWRTKPNGRPRAFLFVGGQGQAWTSNEVDVDPAEVRSLFRAGSSVALVLAAPGNTGLPGMAGSPVVSECRIAYLRPSGPLGLSMFDRPSGLWTVLGLRDGLRIVAVEAQSGTVTTRRVDAISGRTGEAEALSRLPADVGSILRLPLLLGVMVVALVLAAVTRPGSSKPRVLPADVAPLPPLWRVMALVLDMVPGGVVSMLTFGCSVGELLGVPLVTASLEDSGPYVVMAAVTMLHSLLGEVFARRTLGKWMLGARVMAVDGSRPGAGYLIVRNATKMLTVLVPPLAVVALAGPNYQGLHDWVGRTVVVREREKESGEGSRS